MTLTLDGSSADFPAYRYGYYLLLAQPAKGCEDCYVPLLLLPERIERIVDQRLDVDCVLVTTYERDSIWDIERAVRLSSKDIKVKERSLRFRKRAYRYQEVTAAEVLRLLEAPEGTIPIHRIKAPPTRESLQDLVSTFWAEK
jgi:hypothetical protein